MQLDKTSTGQSEGCNTSRCSSTHTVVSDVRSTHLEGAESSRSFKHLIKGRVEKMSEVLKFRIKLLRLSQLTAALKLVIKTCFEEQ